MRLTEKNNLEKFINKYSLNGKIETAKLISSNKTLSTTTFSNDKNVVVTVSTSTIILPDGEYNIFQTSILAKMIKVLENTIQIDAKHDKFLIKDSHNSIKFSLADPTIIPVSAKGKIMPTADLSISLDLNIMNTFNKAISALSDEETFTIMTNDVLMPQIVLGYNKRINNTNQISINLADKEFTKDIKPLKFNAAYLGSIFSVNKEQFGILEFSEQGLITVTFSDEDFTSTYYLFEVVD